MAEFGVHRSVNRPRLKTRITVAESDVHGVGSQVMNPLVTRGQLMVRISRYECSDCMKRRFTARPG